MIETAKAKLEAAKLDAQAEIVRAEGIAKANKIIGQSLNDNRAYLEWLWIDNIEKNQNAVFYVPTENKVPIFNFTSKAINSIQGR
jgi:regulator of protease activity HflC (stomatin/prohibitin superfamily)